MSVEAALRLNPRGLKIFSYLSVGAAALIMLNRFEDAADWTEQSLRHPRGKHNFWNHASLASALRPLDRLDEAREARDGLLRLRPDFSPELIGRMLVWSDVESLTQYFDGLRKAGLEV